MVSSKSIPALAFIAIEVICIATVVFGLLILFSPAWISGGGICKFILDNNNDFPILSTIFTFVVNSIIGVIVIFAAGFLGVWTAIGAGIVSVVKQQHTPMETNNSQLPIKDIEQFDDS